MPNPRLSRIPSLLGQRLGWGWTPLQKAILSLIFIALGTGCLAVTLVRWGEWLSRPGPVPVAAPLGEAIDVDSLLEAAFQEPLELGKEEILALYVLHTEGCLLCVNDLSDYAGLLEDQAGTAQALLWVGEDRAQAARLSAILNLDIPIGFIASAQVPDGLQAGLGRAQAAAFILPAENRVFFRILLTTAGSSLARKQAYLAKMLQAGQASAVGQAASQTPLKGE